MGTQWDMLSKVIDSFVYDNIEIAWPVIFKHVDGLKQGSYVIDYGCGTGALCRELYNLGYEVVGIDASESLLNRAKEQSPERITYVHGCQDVLKHYTGKIDAIISVMVLQFIEDVESLAKEMNASLKQGGIVSIAVFNPEFVLECADKFFKGLDRSGSAWVTKSRFDEISIDTYIRDEKQYKQIFEEARFRFCSSHYPPFTKEFLEKHDWPLPADKPEYLIMKFEKS